MKKMLSILAAWLRPLGDDTPIPEVFNHAPHNRLEELLRESVKTLEGMMREPPAPVKTSSNPDGTVIVETNDATSPIRLVQKWGYGKFADVKLAVCPAGVTMALHEHPESMEIAVVINGMMILKKKGGGAVMLRSGESIVIPTGRLHAGSFPVDTELLLFLIPRAPEYASRSAAG